MELRLRLCETEDCRHFISLADELTLEEFSTAYGFSRYITDTCGWESSCNKTRLRIIESAKRLVVSETDEPEACADISLTEIRPGYMAAIWLLLSSDAEWLKALPLEWWQRWSWYIIRELRPGMSGEDDVPKVELLRMLHDRTKKSIRASLSVLSTSTIPGADVQFSSLLFLLNSVDDAVIESELCAKLMKRKLPQERVLEVARFLLRKGRGKIVFALEGCLNPEFVTASSRGATSVAIAFMLERFDSSWPLIESMLRKSPELQREILGGFAGAGGIVSCLPPGTDEAGFAFDQIGQLLIYLFRVFPPGSDPQRKRVYHPALDDHGRDMRDQLLSWLGGQSVAEAIPPLKRLEEQLGEEYPWLRRPRSQAERNFRLSSWSPIPSRSIAEILSAQKKRLIRTVQDAIDGIVEAVGQYAHRLHHGSPSGVEDLWNKPRNAVPTPRDEERVSDKICEAIRDYFERYAVAAEREVQIFRRIVASDAGGSPGSLADVLVRVPAVGTESINPIAIPVEVKLSHNPEARTGLREQLVDRYMSQLDATAGVFVVAWMNKVTTRSHFRPVWPTLEAAREFLEDQSRKLFSEEGAIVRPIVIDASLPVVKKSKKVPGRGSQPKKKPGAKKSSIAPRSVKERSVKAKKTVKRSSGSI